VAGKQDNDRTHKAPAPPRQDRLKAALKANMAKRKAQAKVRDGKDKGQDG
jgi:hypothetical protein